MRRWWLWGWLSALLLSFGLPLAGLAGAPDNDEDKPAVQQPGWRSTSVIDKLFPGDGSPQPPKAAPRPASDRDKPRKPDPVEKATPVEKPAGMAASASALREREERAYLRRQAVCDKLHEIAEQTRDEELERKVRQLDERIWSLYQERTNRLPAADAVVDMDEAILDKHLGKTTGSATPTTSGKDHGSQAAIREVKP
jgi:hypothetical protein